MSKSRISPHFLFHFHPSQTICEESSRLHISYFRVVSTLTLGDKWGSAIAARKTKVHPLFFAVAPQGACFINASPACFNRGSCIVRLKADEVAIRVKWKRGEMEDTSVTMKDLWQALRAGGGFISLLSTKSPPLRCSTHLLCSTLSLFCILAHSLSRSMLSPAAITIHNLTSPTLPFTSALVFTRLPSFPSSSSSSLWLCVSCSVDPSCLSFSPAHSCFSALLLSPPPSPLLSSTPSLLSPKPLEYFLSTLLTPSVFPPTACLYICLLFVIHEGS